MAGPPDSPLRLLLAPGASLEPGEGSARARTPLGEIPLGEVPGPVAEALSLLSGAGASEDALAARAGAGGLEAAARLHLALARLARGGALHLAVWGGDVAIATLEPTTPYFQLEPRELDPDQPVRLSRFASLRRDGERMVLESPRAHARAALQPPAVSVVARLAAPATPRALAGADPPGLALLGLLRRAGLLVDADAQGVTEEERPPLALWEHHDLLFHARSRRRQRGQGIGPTWRLAGAVPPLPAVSPPAGEVVGLPAPDLSRLARADPPLWEVMERRRSIRRTGERPLTAAQLGELLFRCARVKERFPEERDEVSRRPYPSGGKRYSLEIYATLGACEGLEPGLYRYEPAGHGLERRGGMTPQARRLLADAQVGPAEPQVLLTLAARFGRVQWKYEAIAYALVLKEAGILIQSLSLAATAMGLAACAVGYGDPDLFERAAGVDGSAESSVAELVVGSAPPES